jgi:hypothetical protein
MAKDKNPFADLSDEFKAAVDSMNIDEIKKRVAEVSLSQCEIMAAKKLDEDYISKKELAKEAGAVYRESTKQNGLKISYCKSVLDAKGAT